MSMIAVSLVAAIVATAQAPADTTGQIRGRATSIFNGRPLAGVMVSVPMVQKFVVTDSRGLFWLGGLPSGPLEIHISYEGRETLSYQLLARGGRAKQLAILLDVRAEDLDPVVVEAQNPDSWRDLAGFYERMEAYRGFARFFTREDIDHIQPLRISSLLTLEGIATRCMPFCLPTRFSRGALCAIPIDVNGMPLREDDYDHISVSDVAAVEVYRGPPPRGLSFALPVDRSSAVWGGSYETTRSCGLVAIWTR